MIHDTVTGDKGTLSFNAQTTGVQDAREEKGDPQFHSKESLQLARERFLS